MGVLRPAPVVAIALALIGPGTAARGGDGDPDPEWVKARAAAAELVVRHADWCRDLPFRIAGSHYETALALDPGNARARDGRKAEADLRAGKTAPKPVPRDGPKAKPAPAPGPGELAAAEVAAYGKAAELVAEVARAQAKRGSLAAAARSWTDVLALDPGHEEARGALGLTRAEKGWLRADIDGPAATAKKFLSLAERATERVPVIPDSGGKPTASDGDADRGRCTEARFGARSDDPRVSARSMLEVMLRVEALYEGAGLVPPRTGASDTFLLVLTRSEITFKAAIDARGDRDAAWKAEASAFSGIWWHDGNFFYYSPDRRYALDTAAHQTGHFLLRSASGDAEVPPWLLEGTAFVASSASCGPPLVSCAEAGESSVRRPEETLGDWDDEARRLVARGDDPPLRSLIESRINALSQEGRVKCRSVVAWLMAASPKAPGRLAAAAAHAPSREDLFLRVLGAPPEAVERRWRLWALRP